MIVTVENLFQFAGCRKAKVRDGHGMIFDEIITSVDTETGRVEFIAKDGNGNMVIEFGKPPRVKRMSEFLQLPIEFIPIEPEFDEPILLEAET